MLVLIAALCLALGVSFVCSLFEACLLSLTPANIAYLIKKNPKTGRTWQSFKEVIGRPISVILFLNTSAHTIGASVAGAKFAELFGEPRLWLFSIVFTFFMLQYTEILPKTLGVRYRMLLALYGAAPLAWSIRVFSPLIRLIHFINRPFAGKGGLGEDDAVNPIDEITSLASMARVSNLIGSRQEKIIFSATHLAGISARQVMIPMEQVIFLSTRSSIHDAFLMAHSDLHTRYPVRDGQDSTKVVGYVNFKELVYFMSTNPRNPALAGIIRPLNFVSPETNASDLLRLFVDQHNHLVVVRDAAGRSLGIVTIEDVVEELVGEIEDEFDRLPQYIHPLAGGVWMVGGGTLLPELAKSLGMAPAERGEAMAVSAWLARELGPGYKRGDVIRRNGFEFMVRRIKRGRIFDAVVNSLSGAGAGEEAKK